MKKNKKPTMQSLGNDGGFALYFQCFLLGIPQIGCGAKTVQQIDQKKRLNVWEQKTKRNKEIPKQGIKTAPEMFS